MPITPFPGKLNANTNYQLLFNYYTFVGGINDQLSALDTSNATKYKMDAGEYEDQKVWFYSDVLTTRPFDPDNTNLLRPEQKATIMTQSMDIDQFRTIGLYIPTYFLTKQVFGSPTYFDQFQAGVESQIQKTRKLYDQRLVDTYIGVTITDKGLQKQTITLPTNEDPEKQARLRGQTVAKKVADIKVLLGDSSRDFNDIGFMEATSDGDLTVYWNSDFYTEFTLFDTPGLYHDERIMPKGETLPAAYFGDINTTSGTTPASNTTIRSMVEGWYATSGGSTAFYDSDLRIPSGATNVTHILPRDLLPNSVPYAANMTYTTNPNIICKITGRDAIKYLSAIETSRTFDNGLNCSRQMWLHFGYGGPDRLAIRPFITLIAE